jgi:CRP-like cAMP-binding protein
MLKEHPFFADFPDADLKELVECAAYVRFEEDELLFREGDPADHFYLLRHGRVAVEVATPQGVLTIQTVEAGEVVGWSWLVPPYRWHFQVRALELTRALTLDGRCLRAKCEVNGPLGYRLLRRFVQVITGRLEATRLQLVDLYGAGTGKEASRA